MNPLLQLYYMTVSLYNKTHDYHIDLLDQDYDGHKETGDQWEALIKARDLIGEQLVAIDNHLTSFDCNSMLLELYKDHEQIKAFLKVATKDESLDEGTRNIMADRLNSHSLMCKKLKSLLEDYEEEEEEHLDEQEEELETPEEELMETPEEEFMETPEEETQEEDALIEPVTHEMSTTYGDDSSKRTPLVHVDSLPVYKTTVSTPIVSKASIMPKMKGNSPYNTVKTGQAIPEKDPKPAKNFGNLPGENLAKTPGGPEHLEVKLIPSFQKRSFLKRK